MPRVDADGTKSGLPNMSGPCIATEESLRTAIQLGAWVAVVMASQIARYMPLKTRNRRNSTAKFSLTYFPSSLPESGQTEQRAETTLLISPHNSLQFHFVVRPNVGRSPYLSFYRRGSSQRSPRGREAATERIASLQLRAPTLRAWFPKLHALDLPFCASVSDRLLSRNNLALSGSYCRGEPCLSRFVHGRYANSLHIELWLL